MEEWKGRTAFSVGSENDTHLSSLRFNKPSRHGTAGLIGYNPVWVLYITDLVKKV